MCALLGNIIDNAIEATNKINENKYVQLTIREKNNGTLDYSIDELFTLNILIPYS